MNAFVNENGEATVTLADLNEEMGLDAVGYDVCNTIDMFATELDGSGAGINWFDDVKIKNKDGDYTFVTEEKPITFIVSGAKNITVQLDFYVIMNNTVTEVHIEPGSFGGFFYVEAQTLFRREDTGKDMAAELIIPKAKVQSGFTFTMAASGDPSTFDFVMDAFPGYTRFDSTSKKMCVIQIVGADKAGEDDAAAHTHDMQDPYDTPAYENDDNKTEFRTYAAVVNGENAEAVVTGAGANQDKATMTRTVTDGNDAIVLTIAGGKASLNNITPQAGWPEDGWVAVDYKTDEDTIVGLEYINRGTTTVLSATDVADAAALGLGAGHFVVWVRSGGVLPSEFTLQKKDADGTVVKTVDVTIDMVDGQ
jgi:hypothetical protein